MRPDLLSLRSLWAEIFGASESYLDIFFETYYRSALILTEERSGSLISALWGLPFRFSGGLKGLYLCGLSTIHQWRGEGIMSGLMREAENWAIRNNFDFSFLIPADEDLRRYYAARGYRDALCRTSWKLSPKAAELPGINPAADDLMALESREAQSSFRPCILHNKEDWNAIVRESDISGGRIFCSQIFDSDGNQIIDAAAFCERTGEEESMRIVKVMGDHDACERLLTDLGAVRGAEEPYGMWKSLSEAARGVETPVFYLLLD